MSRARWQAGCERADPRVRRRRRARGFSILEVMAAGVIFLVALSAVLTGMHAVRVQREQQRHLTTALHVGEYVLEELLLRYSTSPDLDSGVDHARAFDRSGHETTDESAAVYRVRWTTTPSEAINGIREVHLRVEWLLDGHPRSIRFVTHRP